MDCLNFLTNHITDRFFLMNSAVIKKKIYTMYTIFDKITTLDVDHQECANIIFRYLYFFPSLKDLKINNVTCATDDDMNKLSEYLFQSIRMPTPDLSSSFWNLKGVEVLKCYCIVQYLVIDQQFDKVLPSHERNAPLNSTSLKYLNCENDLTLSTLDLSLCNLQNLEIKNESWYNYSLKVLKCNHSKICNKLLRSFILIFRNIAHLEIKGNNLCDEGVTTLYNVLFNNENDQELHLLFNLKILNIADNDISNKSTRCLAIKMILNPELDIDYSKNLLSEENIMIFKMIKRLRTINESFECKPAEVKALSFILACINDNAVFQSVPSDIVSIINNITRLD